MSSEFQSINKPRVINRNPKCEAVDADGKFRGSDIVIDYGLHTINELRGKKK